MQTIRVTSRGEHVATRLETREILDSQKLAAYLQPQWYAVYTRANHERRVADQLAGRGVDHFMPQYESVRKWKDRKMHLQLPLFPGYVFVHLPLQHRLVVLQVPGVVRLVGFDGQPVAMPQEEIARIRELLDQGFRVKPHPYLQVGRHVRVLRGPLKGMEGVFLHRKNGSRFVISFSSIERAMAVEVAAEDIF